MHESFQELVRRTLSQERYLHSTGTADTAASLAKEFGADPDKAYLAGLLHDIAREDLPSDILPEAKSHGIIVRTEDRRLPLLLHGKVAAARARELGVEDPDILDAISSHVAGRRGWTRLEQVVYLADKIEPTRDYPGVARLRSLVQEGYFTDALKECLANAIGYAASHRGVVDPETVVVFNEIP